ncbi:Malonyl CoA-acyl carrier protein transacylase [bacterium HR36]|nr:Malonyl CoA-acyl carrier protein transacylase [bacterium HR36]
MPRIAFLFAGQGAQYVGMGKTLLEQSAAARDLFARASEILGYDLASICLEGPAETLNRTDVSQPAIFVASLAALEHFRSEHAQVVAECQAAAGLSLGEYTALTFAGVMDFEDGVRLVQRRGQAMQSASEATPSGMVSILGMETAAVEQLCQRARAAGRIWIANYLAPGNIVVSGDKAACDRIEQLVNEAGLGKTVRLSVAGAFHTEIMRPADEHLAAALRDVQLRPARIPVYSNVDAQPHTQPEEIRTLLVRQLLQPVRWEETMRRLLAEGFDQFYEFGPGRVLAGLLKRIHRHANCVHVPA